MIRDGRLEDMPAIFEVRTSVRENHLSVAQLAARGITPANIAADMEAGDLGCWVSEEAGAVVAFSMADCRRGEVWALFTMPGHEGRGHGSGLLESAERWLNQQGFGRIFAETGRETAARGFYARRGWFEIESPAADAEDVRMAKQL